MSEPADLIGRVRPAAEAPEGALVLLHGRGTDEHDLHGLLDIFDPRRRLLGATPRAPLALAPGGRHWYALGSLGRPEPTTFNATRGLLGRWLDGLAEDHGLAWDRIVLGGFSQGAVMSYAMGLGSGRPRPAGILALSGFVPEAEGFALDLQSRPGLPVAIAHGTQDPVIGVEFGRRARDLLTPAGLRVSYWESAMAHTIDPRLIPALSGWLESVVPVS